MIPPIRIGLPALMVIALLITVLAVLSIMITKLGLGLKVSLQEFTEARPVSPAPRMRIAHLPMMHMVEELRSIISMIPILR